MGLTDSGCFVLLGQGTPCPRTLLSFPRLVRSQAVLDGAIISTEYPARLSVIRFKGLEQPHESVSLIVVGI